MTAIATTSPCRQHLWERRLEVHEEVECVVQVCGRCGRKELCWSRRPFRPAADGRLLQPDGRQS